MKKLFLLIALLAAMAAQVCATDVQISATTFTNLPFNPGNIGSDRTIMVSVTNSSPTVMSSALFPQAIVGIGGFKVSINGTVYTVASVASTSQLTLTTNYTDTSGTAVLLLYKYVLFRAYADRSFRPLGESYVVQPGTPGTGSFFKQVACSIINDGANSALYLPAFTLPATTDALITNQARYILAWYRPEGSLIQFFTCGSTTQLALPTTSPTNLGDICVFNAPGVYLPPGREAYSKFETDDRFPSCTAGQMIYYATTGKKQSCLNVGAGLSISGNTLMAMGGGGGLADPGSSGVVVRTTPNVTVARTLTGTANEITVTDGNGMSANPTFSLAATFDISAHASTKPIKTGTTAPATCGTGEYFFDTDATPGQNTFACTAPNTWVLQGPGGTMNPTDTVIPYRSSAGAFADSQLIRITSSVTDLRSGLTSQVFNIYNTADSGAGSPTNFERLSLKFASNVITFGSEAGGTGQFRPFNFSGTSVGINASLPGAQLDVASAAASVIGTQISSAVNATADILRLRRSTTNVMAVDSFGALLSSPSPRNSGSPLYVRFQTPVDTTLTADTEAIGIQLGGNVVALSETRQFNQGVASFTQQREIVAVGPTYSFTSADTIGTAATVAITGAPVAGTNATISLPLALWIQSGNSRFDGNVQTQNITAGGFVSISPATPQTTKNTTLRVDSPSFNDLAGGGDTINDILLEAAGVINFVGGGGAFTSQRNIVVMPGTYTADAAQTITTAATFAIEGAPTAGSNITITNNYAFWVQAGQSLFADRVNTTATATNAALRIGSVSSDPSTLANGDLWYNTTDNKFKCRENGATTNCIGAGGGATINPTDTVIPYRSNSTTFADSQLIRISSTVTDLRNSTNSQVFNIYNTADSGAASPTNYERLGFKYTSNVFTFTSEAGGTGTVRNFNFAGANVGINAASPGAQLAVISSATNKVGALVQSAASATVDIFRVNRDISSMFRIDAFGAIISAPDVRTSGSDRFVQFLTPPDTGLTADTESIGIQFGGNASAAATTRQFTAGGGSFTTQREIVAVAPRYAFTSADTIDTAATFSITGSPIAGTNATITNSYSLWVDTGPTFLGGNLLSQAAARTGSPLPFVRVITPADTTLTASTESIGVQVGGNSSAATVTRQFATGGITTQREHVFVHPTYGFVGASTITTAATVAITNAPAAGTNATITAPFALLIQSGSLGVPQGSASNPAIRDASDTGSTTGFYFRQSGVNASIDAVTGGTVQFALNQNGFQIASGSGYGISSGNPALAAPDVGFMRRAAGVGRITDGSTGAGQLLLGTSSDTAGAQLDVRSQNAARIGLRVDSLANSTADLVNWNLNADDTSTVATLATFDARSNGTAATGFGESITYTLESSTTDAQNAARQSVLWTDATHASRTAAITFETVNNGGSLAERMRINFFGIQLSAVTQANLGTPSNGTVTYCSDCTIANPCASGGTGAIAKRLNGVWVCN